MTGASRLTLVVALAVASLASTMPAQAGDALPLRRGIYVMASVPCYQRSNGSSQSFWGDRLNTSHEVGHIRSVKVDGSTYRLTMLLEDDDGDGGVQKRTVNRVLRLASPTKFYETVSPNVVTPMRWCAEQMVP